MRIIRFILDLPWWAGLAIFLVANLVIPLGVAGLVIGLFFSFLGMWIFSKLLIPDKYPSNVGAFLSLPLFITFALVFSGNVHWGWVSKDFIVLYGLRAMTGMFFGLTGFNGFRK